jgi:hypothetical protein
VTSPDPADREPAEDIQAEIKRLDDERSELLRQAREIRVGLTDAGPVDLEDRTATITQAEELEALAEELRRRRETLQDRLRE